MTILMSIIFLFLLGIMVHKALGCLAEEDGSNYSKARIAMLIVGMIFLGFFIWLIVLSVAINKNEHSEHKGIYINNNYNQE